MAPHYISFNLLGLTQHKHVALHHAASSVLELHHVGSSLLRVNTI